MSKLTEQLREALTPDEQGNIHLSHEILASIPALLDEHEKLEREAEAGKYLVQCLKTMTPWCGVREAEYVEKRIFDYRQAVKEKEV